MEEKERYELKYVDNGFDLCEEFVPAVVDTTKNRYLEEYTEIVDELNQQYKRIKELEQEKQQLKQQLHDLPKKIVCEISESIERLSWRKRIYTNWEFDKEQLYKDLDTILKKYGGENESNND